MAEWQGPRHGIIVNTEAAKNEATLGNLATIAPLENEFVAGDGTFKFAHDIYLNYFTVMADVANFVQATLSGSNFAGGRNIIDAQENFGIETPTALSTGFHDLRTRPILIPKGDDPRWKTSEDASTNAEFSIVTGYSIGSYFPMAKKIVIHRREAGSVFDIKVTGASTAAVTWTRSTNTLADNAEAILFEPDSRYTICKTFCAGSATIKAWVLDMPGLPGPLPGCAGAVDGNQQPIPVFDPFEYVPISCSGEELNASKVAVLDVAGSETAVIGFSIRKL